LTEILLLDYAESIFWFSLNLLTTHGNVIDFRKPVSKLRLGFEQVLSKIEVSEFVHY